MINLKKVAKITSTQPTNLIIVSIDNEIFHCHTFLFGLFSDFLSELLFSEDQEPGIPSTLLVPFEGPLVARLLKLVCNPDQYVVDTSDCDFKAMCSILGLDNLNLDGRYKLCKASAENYVNSIKNEEEEYMENPETMINVEFADCSERNSKFNFKIKK